MAEPKNKNLLEKIEDGRYRIIENYRISSSNTKKLPITESNRIVEIDGKEYKCRGAYSGVEISRPNKENLNERIYSDKLWENVITNQQSIWDGSSGLVNHPTNEADVGKTCIVWHNLRFNENKDLVIADMYCVGDYGQLIVEILDAGGKVGLSTSGFGDFKSDGKTIDESYEIERVADWVDAPSYQVFARKENEMELPENKDTNSITDDKQLSEKEITNNKEDESLKEIETMSVNKDSNKIEEKIALVESKNFKLNMRNIIKEIENNDSIKGKLEGYKEALTYFDGIDFADDIKESIENKIEELNKAFEELAEKGSTVDKLEESKKEVEDANVKISEDYAELKESHLKLTKKYEVATQYLDSMKKYVNELKELYNIVIAEKNGMVEAEEYVILSKKYDELKESISKKSVKEADKKDMDDKSSDKKDMDDKSADKKDTKDDSKKDDKDTKDDSKKDDKDTKDDSKKDDKDSKDDSKDDEKKDKKESRTRSNDLEVDTFDFKNSAEVEFYFEDLVSRYPEAEKVREEILDCKTLFEAQRKWLNLEDEVLGIPLPSKKHYMIADDEMKVRVAESRRDSDIRNFLPKGWK